MNSKVLLYLFFFVSLYSREDEFQNPNVIDMVYMQLCRGISYLGENIEKCGKNINISDFPQIYFKSEDKNLYQNIDDCFKNAGILFFTDVVEIFKESNNKSGKFTKEEFLDIKEKLHKEYLKHLEKYLYDGEYNKKINDNSKSYESDISSLNEKKIVDRLNIQLVQSSDESVEDKYIQKAIIPSFVQERVKNINDDLSTDIQRIKDAYFDEDKKRQQNVKFIYKIEKIDMWQKQLTSQQKIAFKEYLEQNGGFEKFCQDAFSATSEAFNSALSDFHFPLSCYENFFSPNNSLKNNEIKPDIQLKGLSKENVITLINESYPILYSVDKTEAAKQTNSLTTREHLTELYWRNYENKETVKKHDEKITKLLIIVEEVEQIKEKINEIKNTGFLSVAQIEELIEKKVEKKIKFWKIFCIGLVVFEVGRFFYDRYMKNID